MESITLRDLPELFRFISDEMSGNKDRLTEMDAVMGDGDLGLTMEKGFAILPDFFRQCEESDFGKALVKGGWEVINAVPSTMGTLMGSGLSFGGKEMGACTEMDREGLLRFLEGFCKGIVKRGKCQPGDRTILDAINRAHTVAADAYGQDSVLSFRDLVHKALIGAEEGVEATKEMMPKFGKALVHSAKALGTPDQGAYAGMLLLKGFADFCDTKEQQ